MSNTSLLTQAEYAAHRGISPSAVCQAVKAGRIELVNGKINPEIADEQWRNNTDHGHMLNALSKRMSHLTDHPTDSSGSAPNDYLLWKARRERAEALRAEQNQELEAGNLYQKAAADRAAKTMARLLRDQLLSIPNRLAAQLSGINDSPAIEKILSAEIRKALETIERKAKDSQNA